MTTLFLAVVLAVSLLAPGYAVANDGTGGVRPCSRVSLSVTYANGEPLVVDTLFGYNRFESTYTLPFIALDDLAKALHAKASFDGSHGTLAIGSAVATFASGSKSVTFGGRPVHDLSIAPLIYRGKAYVPSELVAAFPGMSQVYDDVFDAIPDDSAGHPIGVPAQCLPKAIAPAKRALVALARLPYPKRTVPTPFCALDPFNGSELQAFTFDAFTVAARPIDDALRRRAMLTRAHAEICNGYYAAAERDLATLQAYFRTDSGGGEDRPEFERHFILAESMNGHADAALALLRKNALMAAPRAFFDGDLCGAMKSFAAAEADFPRSPDGHDAYVAHGSDPHLKSAVDAACAGDLDRAVVEMRTVEGDATSLYETMLGALYARQSKWALAGAQWWKAGGDYPGIAAMEEVAMSDPQFESRWLLYYYRAHFAGL